MKTPAKIFLKTLQKETLSASSRLISAAFLRNLLIDALGRKLKNSRLRFLALPAAVQGLKLITEVSQSAVNMPETSPGKVSAGMAAEQGISGALAGALIYKADGKKVVKGAVIGCAAALAAVYASYYLRHKLAKNRIDAGPVLKVIGSSLVSGSKKLAS